MGLELCDFIILFAYELDEAGKETDGGMNDEVEGGPWRGCWRGRERGRERGRPGRQGIIVCCCVISLKLGEQAHHVVLVQCWASPDLGSSNTLVRAE